MTRKYLTSPAHEAFCAELRALYIACGKPSYRNLASLSKRLTSLYGQRNLPQLSSTAVCEILAGRRKDLPSAAWLASFVLCCQRSGWAAGNLDEDPGPLTLPGWQERLRAAQAQHTAHITGNDLAGTNGLPSPANRLDLTRPAPAPGKPETPAPRPGMPSGTDTGSGRSDDRGTNAGSAGTVRLPSAHHGRIAAYGAPGRALLAEIKAGIPEAIYRAALLLGHVPAYGDQALTLLIEAGATRHRPALDLLEASSTHLNRRVAAQHAYELATTMAAADDGSEAALVYYECAAEYGLPAAAVELANALLDKGQAHLAANWLAVAADRGDTTAMARLTALGDTGRVPSWAVGAHGTPPSSGSATTES